MFRSKIQTAETEKQVERQQVEQVFGLTGGELNDKPWGGYAYNYDGAPEWATEDFSREQRYSRSDDIHTVVVTGGGYLPNPDETMVVDGEVWVLAHTYTHSGERECFYMGCEETDTVKRDQCWLVETFPKNRPNHGYRPSDLTAKRAECPLCEERVGKDHGYVYVGNSYEAVYVRAPYEGPKEEQDSEGFRGW